LKNCKPNWSASHAIDPRCRRLEIDNPFGPGIVPTMKPVLLFLLLAVASAHGELPWKEILFPEPAKLPLPASFKAKWPGDLDAAFAEARKTGRPIFVTMRCLPCKQCSAFDKEVLEGGQRLDPLLTQFVTVRLTNANLIDLRIFPIEGYQDLDMSWWGWFLSPEGQVYGVFGGRDHVSDATRISEEALANTLKRILDFHYDSRRKQWPLELPMPRKNVTARKPSELPGHDSFIKRQPGAAKHFETCIHCHQVAEFLRLPAVEAGTFDKIRDTQVWPLPENVGLTVDRDHGLLVTSVESGSAADKAGLRKGDVLAAAEETPLFGQADFRGVLHRGPSGSGNMDVIWKRGGKLMEGTLEVEDGWRVTNLDWRKTMSEGVFGPAPEFFPLQTSDADRRKRGISEGSMAARVFLGKRTEASAAWRAGIRHNDIVVSVNGENPDITGRPFLVWFRMNHAPGDTVRMEVVSPNGKRKTVSYQLGM